MTTAAYNIEWIKKSRRVWTPRKGVHVVYYPRLNIVDAYNLLMGNVDHGDQLRLSYRHNHFKTHRKWWLNVYWFMFFVYVTNAYTLHAKLVRHDNKLRAARDRAPRKPHSHRAFLEFLAEGLIFPHTVLPPGANITRKVYVDAFPDQLDQLDRLRSAGPSPKATPARKKAGPGPESRSPKAAAKRKATEPADGCNVDELTRFSHQQKSHPYKFFDDHKPRNNRRCARCTQVGNGKRSPNMFCRVCRQNLCLYCWQPWHGVSNS